MASLQISLQVKDRDQFGRFIAMCDQAARDAAEEIADVGARSARVRAPSGPARADYGRRPKLRRSIKGYARGKTAHWSVDTPHAMPQEFGAGPHRITGNPFLAFKGRRGTVVTKSVMHPGNKPQPYMRPAVDMVRARMLSILRKHYPS